MPETPLLPSYPTISDLAAAIRLLNRRLEELATRIESVALGVRQFNAVAGRFSELDEASEALNDSHALD